MVKLTDNIIYSRTKSSPESVRRLNLWGCDVDDIEVVSKMPNLEVLSLSVNQIESLAPIGRCLQLQELYLRKNNVSDLRQVDHLANLPKLRVLWLDENPCAFSPSYRLYVLHKLPHLHSLDNQPVTTIPNFQDEQANFPVVTAEEVAQAHEAAASSDLLASEQQQAQQRLEQQQRDGGGTRTVYYQRQIAQPDDYCAMSTSRSSTSFDESFGRRRPPHSDVMTASMLVENSAVLDNRAVPLSQSVMFGSADYGLTDSAGGSFDRASPPPTEVAYYNPVAPVADLMSSSVIYESSLPFENEAVSTIDEETEWSNFGAALPSPHQSRSARSPRRQRVPLHVDETRPQSMVDFEGLPPQSWDDFSVGDDEEGGGGETPTDLMTSSLPPPAVGAGPVRSLYNRRSCSQDGRRLRLQQQRERQHQLLSSSVYSAVGGGGRVRPPAILQRRTRSISPAKQRRENIVSAIGVLLDELDQEGLRMVIEHAQRQIKKQR